MTVGQVDTEITAPIVHVRVAVVPLVRPTLGANIMQGTVLKHTFPKTRVSQSPKQFNKRAMKMCAVTSLPPYLQCVP